MFHVILSAFQILVKIVVTPKQILQALHPAVGEAKHDPMLPNTCHCRVRRPRPSRAARSPSVLGIMNEPKLEYDPTRLLALDCGSLRG